MDTEYKETSATPEASAAEAAPEALKKKIPVWKRLLPVLLVLAAAAAVAFLLIGREPVAGSDDYIAELNYANGGLVTYDSEHAYFLSPDDLNSEDKYIVVFEVYPNGDEPRVICKENTIKTIRSAGSELYCLGAKGTDGAPYLARIDKVSGKLTILRRFSEDTKISYFLVRDSGLFYCADGTLYKGVLESAAPSTDTVLLENCLAVHFCGGTVYYSSEDEILAYNLRSGKIQLLCSAAATQICRKGDVLFFMNSDGLFSVGSEGGEPTQLVAHDSSEAYLSSAFSLYNGNILYEYSMDVGEIANTVDSLGLDNYAPSARAEMIFLIGMASLNGLPQYIGEDGGEPVGAERPICSLKESSDSNDLVSGFYITPYQTYFSINLASYSFVSTIKFS